MGTIYRNNINYGSGRDSGEDITYEEYMALSEDEKKKDHNYYITDYPSGSGGGKIEYSTEEKEVGTWVDGKPLYEKTLVMENVTGGRHENYPHGINNIDSACYTKCMLIHQSGAQSVVGLSFDSASLSNEWLVGVWVFGRDGLYFDIGTGWVNNGYNKFIVTLQYTKTTD